MNNENSIDFGVNVEINTKSLVLLSISLLVPFTVFVLMLKFIK